MGLYVWKFGYRKILEPWARKLAWLDPDIVSYAALIISGFTAGCYFLADEYPVLLLLAILLIFTRMTMNTIDGVMAIQRGKKTLVGEIVNALPDRYADVLLLLGLIFCPLCRQDLAVGAMGTVFLVSYTGMLGKAVGVSWQHHGPLGKVERLIFLMVFTLIQLFCPSLTIFRISLGPLSWCMALYIVLGQITVLNRLRGQLREVCLKEWPVSRELQDLSGRVLVVYDSQTGNTERIAEKIAFTLSAKCCSLRGPVEARAYDLVVFCTPNIRGKCTARMAEFLKKAPPKFNSYGIVVTYGAPLWGWPTAIKAGRSMARQLGGQPLKYFFVKGYHAKFKTYKGRPNETDQDKAAMFAINIAREMVKRNKNEQ
ncbi:MAG: flavodoxin family protein [Candidatus Omnitrophota bacterium]|jgi:phosphatidylglycerophosphate synthase/flavodoxin